MNDGILRIACGPRDDYNNRSVVATLNGFKHVDCFDTDRERGRRNFREAVIRKFDLGEDAHGYIEQRIIDAADAADAEPAELDTPNIINVEEVIAERVEWLWPDYLPRGSLVMADGDPGLGKSQLTCSLAACVSKGDPFPTEPTFVKRDPQGVLMLGCEDDIAKTVRPRLDAAGADVSRVKVMETITTADGAQRLPSLPGDVPMLERLVKQFDVGLMVLDPIVNYLDPKLSMNCDADVRRALSPLASMAQRTGVCVLLVRHLNKKGSGPALYRGGGSIGLVGACRAAFIVAACEDDPDLRVFAPTKTNLGPRPESLLFRIEPHEGTSRVAWCGTTHHTADELMAEKKQSGSGSKVDTAMGIIADILANGARGEPEVREACEAAGIGNRTYWRARKQLGVKAEKVAEYQGQWLLSLPSDNGCQHEY